MSSGYGTHHPPRPQRPPPPPPTSIYHRHPGVGTGAGDRPNPNPNPNDGPPPNGLGLRHVSVPTRMSAAQALARAGIQRCDAVPTNEAWSRYGFRSGNPTDSLSDVGGRIRGASVGSGPPQLAPHTPISAPPPPRELPWSSPPLSSLDSRSSTPFSRRAVTPVMHHRRAPSVANSTASRYTSGPSLFSPPHNPSRQSSLRSREQQQIWRHSIPVEYTGGAAASAATMHERMLKRQLAHHRVSTPQLQQQYQQYQQQQQLHAVQHRSTPQRPPPPRSQQQGHSRQQNQSQSQSGSASQLRQTFGPPTILPAPALPGPAVSRQSSSYSHSTASSSLSAASILSGPLKLKPGQLVPRCLSEAAGSCSSSIISGFSPPSRRVTKYCDQRWEPGSRPRRVDSPPRTGAAPASRGPPPTTSRSECKPAPARSAPRASHPTQIDDCPHSNRVASMPKTYPVKAPHLEEGGRGPENDQISEFINLYRNRSIRLPLRHAGVAAAQLTRASTPDAASRTFSTRSLHSVRMESDADSRSLSSSDAEGSQVGPSSIRSAESPTDLAPPSHPMVPSDSTSAYSSVSVRTLDVAADEFDEIDNAMRMVESVLEKALKSNLRQSSALSRTSSLSAASILNAIPTRRSSIRPMRPRRPPSNDDGVIPAADAASKKAAASSRAPTAQDRARNVIACQRASATGSRGAGELASATQILPLRTAARASATAKSTGMKPVQSSASSSTSTTTTTRGSASASATAKSIGMKPERSSASSSTTTTMTAATKSRIARKAAAAAAAAAAAPGPAVKTKAEIPSSAQRGGRARLGLAISMPSSSSISSASSKSSFSSSSSSTSASSIPSISSRTIPAPRAHLSLPRSGIGGGGGGGCAGGGSGSGSGSGSRLPLPVRRKLPPPSKLVYQVQLTAAAVAAAAVVA
ncbi:hypothetical protein OC844_000126 [Tilletia horrida]|nr:hypothetical protein OC844_000126 [Tilletia horrida]